MNTQVSFKKIDRNPLAVRYTTNKIENVLEKYSMNPIKVSLTYSEQGNFCILEMNMITSQGLPINIKSTSTNFYAAADVVAHKLNKKLRRTKNKSKAIKRRGHKRVHNDFITELQLQDFSSLLQSNSHQQASKLSV